MRCKKCGKRLREKEMFCTICGYYNSADDDDDMEEEQNDSLLLKQNSSSLQNDKSKSSYQEELEEYNEVSSSQDLPQTSDKEEDFYTYKDERLVEAYIGEDYKIIKKSFFNIYAFLLSWMYVLYRKIYILGILGLLLLGVTITINLKLAIVYLLVSMILLGMFFNKIYIFFTSKRVNFLKKKHPETDDFTLEGICAKKGGTNFVPALIIYLIFLIIVFITNVGFELDKNQNSQFWEHNSENKATCTSLAKTAYNDLGTDEITGTLEESICIINQDEFKLYLKMKNNIEINYVSYKTEKGYLILEDSTKDLALLQGKEANKTLTPEEKTQLEKKRQIEDSYYKATEKAKEEDKLLKENKDNSKKNNFIITKKEILR